MQKINLLIKRFETRTKVIGAKKIRYALSIVLITILLLTALLIILLDTTRAKNNREETTQTEDLPISNPTENTESNVISYTQQKESSSNQQTTAEAPVEQIDLSQWQTYSNEIYKIEFKYPTDWELVPNKDNAQYNNGADNTIETIRIRKIDTSLPSVDYGGGNVYPASFIIDIAVIRNDEMLNTREYLNKIDSSAVYKNIKVGNDIKAITFDQMIVGGPGPNPNSNTLFDHDGLLFQVHYYAIVKPENKNELEYYQKNIYPEVLESLKVL